MKSACLLVCVMMMLSGCERVAPGAGYEAVLIQKPIIFGHGGIVGTPVKTGSEYVALSTEAVLINMQPQQFQEHFDDLMSSDGVPLDFDSVIRLKVIDSVALVKNFGGKWYEQNIESELRNRVRQAVRKHGMNETAIDTHAIDKIDEEITSAMKDYLKESNMPIELIQITVGKANPPDSIKNQRVATAAEQQRALTEHQRKLAEDARLKAEESRAAADNAYRMAMNLTPDQFLTLERIKMQKELTHATNCTVILGMENANPMVNVNSAK